MKRSQYRDYYYPSGQNFFHRPFTLKPDENLCFNGFKKPVPLVVVKIIYQMVQISFRLSVDDQLRQFIYHHVYI